MGTPVQGRVVLLENNNVNVLILDRIESLCAFYFCVLLRKLLILDRIESIIFSSSFHFTITPSLILDRIERDGTADALRNLKIPKLILDRIERLLPSTRLGSPVTSVDLG